MDKGRRGKVSLWLILLALAALALGLWFYLSGPRYPVKPAPVGEPVVAVAVQLQDVPVYIDALGTVTPTRSVTVITQVDGILSSVEFKEGQPVRKGQVIARIDDRALKAQLAQARGVLAHDQAVLDNAQRDLARYRELIKAGSVSQQTLDTQVSTVQQQAGTVAADQGSVQNLEVQLSYCTIISPVDGVAGLRLVDPGNYVTTASTTGIVVITQMEPAEVVFAVPEDDLGAISQAMAKGPVPVLAYDRNKHNLLASGSLLALDNQVNTSTGTINVKARFEGAGKALFPNQFVNARLRADTLTQVPVVPTRAIQHGSKGDFVFVVDGSTKAGLRNIKSGPASGEVTAVLDAGVKAGEQVITEGADKLDNGSAIKVVAQ
ncbi:efflux transporter periplasmic adaptor subunit [Pseudomonas protegens]|uniref:efflux RND transporter periplasmic adaptor subunit n=1 Tax=Pseudomonas TaxID=286 RepID=UPI000806F54B|nr:efflux RND transporter periplasmic adaptor subunit [Pseudomonas protegens]OBZ26011.1 efflux transporter periplasmic adaptor subunit [Pseudomonas protegens]OBZ28901.1 efflux transporter periplasmic adaptor subunit [Pseudomonas protegens]OKK39188.1 efflux transporter periplasmic adaptor subunit [Pseudomonas protegens]OKK48086.1 efflux transporter periplasmic adaptor subunit [Pseudomonas protegens]OKK53912.1 efflux transporter periplasmic adaptor subunit [Pseudomonas protegens]